MRRACCSRARWRGPRTPSGWPPRCEQAVEAGYAARRAGTHPAQAPRPGVDAGRGNPELGCDQRLSRCRRRATWRSVHSPTVPNAHASAMRGATRRRRRRAARSPRPGSLPSATAALRTALTWRRIRRSQERQNSGELRVAAGLADGRQIGEQRGDVLEVVDREAKGLVSLQEAVEHGAADRAEVGAASLGGDVAVEVVAGGERTQLLEQLAERLRGLVKRLARCRFRRAPWRAGRAAFGGLAARHVELAVAAVLGGVERHARTVIERRLGIRRRRLRLLEDDLLGLACRRAAPCRPGRGGCARAVHSRNSTSATSFGSTKTACARRLAAGEGALRRSAAARAGRRGGRARRR